MSKQFNQERCPICPDGAWIPYSDGVHTIKHKRKKLELNGMHYCVCNSCGTRGFTEEQVEENHRLIAKFEDGIHDYISKKNIRRIRDKYRITQAEAAEIFQCGESYFSKWERGEIAPTGPTAVLLKNALKHVDFMQHLASAAGIEITIPPEKHMPSPQEQWLTAIESDLERYIKDYAIYASSNNVIPIIGKLKPVSNSENTSLIMQQYALENKTMLHKPRAHWTPDTDVQEAIH